MASDSPGAGITGGGKTPNTVVRNQMWVLSKRPNHNHGAISPAPAPTFLKKYHITSNGPDQMKFFRSGTNKLSTLIEELFTPGKPDWQHRRGGS